MIRNYIKIAWRNLIRNKGFSFINITGLAAALAVFLIIMLYIRHETSYNNFFTDADRIYRILLVEESQNGTTTHSQLPEPIAVELSNFYLEVEGMAKVSIPFGEILLSVDETNIYSDQVLQASENFFSLFDFSFIAGNRESVLQEPNTAVVTRSTALRLFGNVDVLGKPVILDNETQIIISGVVEDPPSHSTIQFDMIQYRQAYLDNTWNFRSAEGYLKLTDAGAAQTLSEKLPEYIESNIQYSAGAIIPDFSIVLQPVTDIHLYPQGPGTESGQVIYIRILFVVAVLILLVACMNYINLSTARGAERSREIGVRKSAGASRGQIIVQIMTASMITSFISFILAVGLTELTIPYVHRYFDIQLLSLFSSSVHWLGVLITTLVAVGIVSGAYAAIYLSSFNPVDVLKGRGSTTTLRFSGNFRKSLVIAQFAISTIIVMSALLISQQMEFIRTERLDGNDEQIILLKDSSTEVYQQYQVFKQELLEHPDIQAVSWGTIPNSISGSTGINDSTQIHNFIVSFDYLETMGLNLVVGRDFDPLTDGANTSVQIINESAAQILELDQSLDVDPDNPKHRRFTSRQPIGIVQDFHINTLYDPITPVDFRVFEPQMGWGQILVRLREGGISSGLDHVQQTWAQFEPSIPLNYSFLDEVLDQDYQAELRAAKIFRVFSGFSIFIACLGLFGLAAYTAQKRTQEIGIRKVLGASVGNIIALLNRDFIKLVMIGFVIATPIAWYAINRWLENFAYSIEPGPGVFLIAGLVAILIALVTVSWQSVRAAVANPVDSLRTE